MNGAVLGIPKRLMNDKICLFIVGFFALMMPISVYAEDTNTVLAEVGDIKITSADVQRKLEEIPSYARSNFETKEGQMKLLDRIVKTQLLMKAAIESNYEEKQEIKDKLAESRERILTSEYFKNEMSNPPSPPDSQLQQYYEKHKEEYRTEASVDAAHILVDTQEKAEEIRNLLSKDEISFDEAVKKYSKDEETREVAGRLGNIRKEGYIRGIGRSAEFEEAVFSLKIGQISEPIKTRLGWHIIRVDAKEDAGYKSFDSVKSLIAEEMLVTDESIEKEYKENPDKYMSRARCKIKHIQVASEKEAKDIYKQLKAGKQFDTLVETKSTDTASVKQKGSLGYLYKDGYIRGIGKDANFETAVFALKQGEFSKPIQTKKGWHIVAMEEKSDELLKPISEVKTQIKNKLIRDMKEKSLEDRFDALKKKFKCTIHEDRIQPIVP